MEIFGKHIFGTDADAWLKLCKEQKKEWILKYTNQKDENLIDEFVKNPKISKECKCLDCGKNGNISKRVSEEVATVTEPIDNEEPSATNRAKRRKKVKGAEN
jgi:hypothetical protein